MPTLDQPSPDDQRILAALHRVFGFREFRPNQREIVSAVLARRDVFAVMPTGGGKSLCYQLPAHLADGTALVVSPLISLMKDQVDAAKANGLRAEFLNSALDGGERSRVGRALRAGELDLLYLSPERLAMDWFLPLLQAIPLSLIAIDEAHCISEWGHDFRKDYLGLDRLVAQFPHVPVAAFTATATHRVQKDIIAKLGLRNPLTVRASFDRPNLFYQVVPKDDVRGQILNFVRSRSGESGIVYRMTRKDVESTALHLQDHKIKALPYHAGLDNDTRKRHQEMFLRDEVQVVVATIAFGMGIDKPNVRFVVHGDLPKNLESYYQETGRSGRDGDLAHCVLFYSYGDVARLEFFVDKMEDPQQRQIQEGKLKQMSRYADHGVCRRRQILGYFGENYPAPNCGACDVCVPKPRLIDAARPAQIVMSAIARTDQQHPADHIIDIVTGHATDKVRQLGHDQIKTFGAGKDGPAETWQQVVADLLAHGCLAQSPEPEHALTLTARGKDVLFGRRGFTLIVSAQPETASPAPAGARPGPAAKPVVARPPEEEDYDSDLFELLRALRKERAKLEGVRPYSVFTDRSLKEMARLLPTTLGQLRQVNGVGQHRLRTYGLDFVRRIVRYVSEHPRRRPPPPPPRPKPPSKAPPRGLSQSKYWPRPNGPDPSPF